jgi:hypothetical protein
MLAMGIMRARGVRPARRGYGGQEGGRYGFSVILLVLAAMAAPFAQESRATPTSALDQLLDLYVRDGFVYYRALKSDRAKLDGYISQQAAVNVEALPRDAQLAFWLNAYNAVVLRTVIDRYPIRGAAPDYPPNSIRQISGAFERLPHRLAGRSLTLDDIEKKVLPAYRDPRVYLALGRGAVGSGRLRSEAFDAARLEAQLTEMADECASRPVCVQIDRVNNKVLASAIFSWREAEFSAAYGGSAGAVFASRSPIERAILSFVERRLTAAERQFLAQNAFQMAYLPFDWSLNDLTGRGGR